jgi:serine protease AprX
MKFLHNYWLLAFVFLPFTLSSQNLQKVHPSVWASMKEGKAEFFIRLKSQADISPAQFLDTKEEKGSFVFNTLKHHAEESQVGLQSFLKAQNVGFQAFWIVNVIFTKGDLSLIEKLSAREDVAEIINNPSSKLSLPAYQDLVPLSTRSVQKLAWGLQKIKADSVWAMGYRGQNIIVAGQDTGYDWEHPGLKPKYRGWNTTTNKADHSYNWHDAIHADTSKRGNPCGYDRNTPCDDNAHGTHTMGTMIGSNDTLIVGVAPDAKWIAARNMDRGDGTLLTYTECFQWFLAPTDTANKNPNPLKAPHVMNNSWGCPPSEGCNTSNMAIMEQALNACRAGGIVVVVSAGNSGSACSSVRDPAAVFAKSFSVGATRSDDTIANFSSRGPVTLDGSGRMKPNISAPGVTVLSTVPGGSFQESGWSGTSMAGPHVAGVVALMISANPKLAGKVDTIERIIESTAKPMTTTQNCGTIEGTKVPNHTYGFGRIDALAAVKKALLYKTTSVKTFDNQTFVKAYPNPFTAEITLYTEGVIGETTIEIFNTNGQLVFSKRDKFIEKNSLLIPLIKSVNGFYFYKIGNGKTVLTGKILKTN